MSSQKLSWAWGPTNTKMASTLVEPHAMTSLPGPLEVASALVGYGLVFMRVFWKPGTEEVTWNHGILLGPLELTVTAGGPAGSLVPQKVFGMIELPGATGDSRS